MYVTEALMDYVKAFSQCGFLMAFLYCLASSINKENKSSVYLSALMLCSCFSSGYINLLESLYLNWALYDFITILALLTLQYFKVLQRSAAFHFIIFALIINTIDVLMMLSLILNKNFLSLIKLSPLITIKSTRSPNA